MPQDQIALFSNLAGSGLYFALAIVLAYLRFHNRLPTSMTIAALASALWQLGIVATHQWQILAPSWLLILEILRGGTWIIGMLACLNFVTGRALPRRFRVVLHGVWIGTLLIATVLKLSHQPLAGAGISITWAGLLIAIVALVSVEQLFRHAEQLRLIKLISVTMAAIFIYDIYLFSHGLIFSRLDPALWQARGIVNAFAALLMTLGALTIADQSGQSARLTISRQVVFYTTSLTLAGCFLALMALAGYYVQLYGGEWGKAIQILLVFVALLAVAAVAVSETLRARLSVWINKHFFRHKYDYRVEWLKLINSLSRPSANNDDLHERAIRAVANIFKSPGGALWLRRGDLYLPIQSLGTAIPDDAEEPIDSPFCSALKQHEWVFSPLATESDRLGTFNHLLPRWVQKIDRLWVILPLLTETELLGFLILLQPDGDTTLTWEDLDLAKTVSRQVASYLDRHEAAEQLAESRQFDAFNRLTAFIMHDLKNLIAQQALVVQNASRHRDNPAFFEDAILTIENSVARMNNLLRKLQQNEPSELRSLELHRALMDAVKKCKEQRPTPTLRLEQTDLRVNADQDRLVMTLAHIIRNAQEATDDSGFVDITLRKIGDTAVIIIEDNGVGMSQEFIRNQLFKPFVSTKSGKGMGIGAYQTREFIASLGGSIEVESAPGEGSTFTITLPISKG
jgi:putative PEP-CTERM system histidine kinase